MEKKFVEFNDYYLTENEDRTVAVGKWIYQENAYYANVLLKEIAKRKGCDFTAKLEKDDDWENVEVALNMVDKFGNPLIVNNYKMRAFRNNEGHRYVWIYTLSPVANKIEVLRGIAERISFKYDLSWDANTLGAKLIDFMK